VLELIKTPEIRSIKEKTFLKTPVNQNRNKRNKENNRNYKNNRNKKLKANNLTIDEQITCFAEIICTQLLKEMNFYEKD
jgi:hypothetical protein